MLVGSWMRICSTAIAFYAEFVEQFGRASSAPEKMLTIDRLIHRFHWELVHSPGRSAARELIYAKNNVELLSFLDNLSYGERSTHGLQDEKANWDRKLDESGWHRMTSFGPAPKK